MIAVIFEVQPHADKASRYFDLAAAMRADLEAIDGFISVERFQSLVTPGKFLSLSFWRDEGAVRAWRNQAGHRAGQRDGRQNVFAGYRIRVAQVLRDYGLSQRDQAPHDSRAAHG
jgi:heme-degrading monooxygenase HmoA